MRITLLCIAAALAGNVIAELGRWYFTGVTPTVANTTPRLALSLGILFVVALVGVTVVGALNRLAGVK